MSLVKTKTVAVCEETDEFRKRRMSFVSDG
jgi:hypothetical protein